MDHLKEFQKALATIREMWGGMSNFEKEEYAKAFSSFSSEERAFMLGYTEGRGDATEIWSKRLSEVLS